jgi:hypothetical protein
MSHWLGEKIHLKKKNPGLNQVLLGRQGHGSTQQVNQVFVYSGFLPYLEAMFVFVF